MIAAIIDDGINCLAEKFKSLWFVDEDLSIKPCLSGDFGAKKTHSDICFEIIQQYSGAVDIAWHSVKVLNEQSRRGNLESFLAALEFCEKIGVKLIHLSMGTKYFMDFDRIEEYVRRLSSKDVIMVAALSNADIVTYPACLPGVIGVRHNQELSGNEYQYVENPRDGIEFEASSKHLLQDGSLTKRANSHAAPLITAHVINFLLGSPEADFKAVFSYLKQNAFSSKEMPPVVFRTRDIGVPIVSLLGFEPREQVKLLRKLRKAFYADGYYCHVASEAEIANDIAFIPTDLDLYSYCREKRGFLDCDLLLLSLDREMSFDNLDEAFSIFVVRESSADALVSTEACVFITYRDNPEALYREILRNISEEE